MKTPFVASRWFVLVATVLLAAPARAEDVARVVLVSGPYADLARLLRAEAAEIGIGLVGGPTEDDSSPLALTRRHQAVGVLRVSARTRVDLWLLPREGGGVLFETIQADAESDESFALRVMEEVRAHLVELHLPVAAPTADAHRPSSGKTTSESDGLAPSSPRPRLGLTAGIGGTISGGGLGASLDGAVGVHASLSIPWRIAARAFLPITSTETSNAKGSAEIRAYLFLAELDYLLSGADGDAPWWTAIGLGAGGALLSLEARGSPGYVGSSDSVASAVGFADVAIGRRLSAWLAVEASLMVGVSAPRSVLLFDGQQVAAWGRPMAAAVLALDVSMPLGQRAGDRVAAP